MESRYDAAAGSAVDLALDAVASDVLLDSGDAPVASVDASTAPDSYSSASIDAASVDMVISGGVDADPVVLSPNVYVISLAALQTATIAAGSLVFSKEGNEALLLRNPGDVLGAADGTFLRRVLSVTTDDSTITITTQDAALAEAVQAGGFDTDIVFGVDQDPYQHVYAHGPLPMALGIDLSGKSLYSSGGLSVVLTQGLVKYTPTCSLHFRSDKLRGPSFSAQLDGAITMAAQVTLSAATSVTTPTATVNIWTSPTYRFYQLIGDLPVGEEVRLSLDASINATAGGKASVSGGYQGQGSLTLGISYKDGTWSNTASAPISFSPVEPTASGEAAVGYTVTITPRVDIVFFPLNKHLVNADVSLATNVGATLEGKFDSNKCPRALDWDASLELKGTGTGTLSALNSAILAYTGQLFDVTFPMGSGSINLNTDGKECSQDETPHCGSNDVFLCCTADYPNFCDTGNMDSAGCWANDGNGKAPDCSTITMCAGSWGICGVGETPHCGTNTKSLTCCPASFPYFLDMNTHGENGSCWSGQIDPSTITDCGDGKLHACSPGSGVVDCSTTKCTKSG